MLRRVVVLGVFMVVLGAVVSAGANPPSTPCNSPHCEFETFRVGHESGPIHVPLGERVAQTCGASGNCTGVKLLPGGGAIRDDDGVGFWVDGGKWIVSLNGGLSVNREREPGVGTTGPSEPRYVGEEPACVYVEQQPSC